MIMMYYHLKGSFSVASSEFGVRIVLCADRDGHLLLKTDPERNLLEYRLYYRTNISGITLRSLSMILSV